MNERPRKIALRAPERNASAYATGEHVSVTEPMTAAKTVACLLADWSGVDSKGV